MTEPKVTIVIVSFNTIDLTRKAITSIYKSKQDVSFEVIVVDNGSTDGSIEMLSNINDIKLIKNSSNLGFAKACNVGIKKAKGKYVMLMNSDVVVSSGYIRGLIDCAKKDQSVGAVSGKLLNVDKTPQRSVLNFPTISNAIKAYWFGQRDLYEKYLPKVSRPIQVEASVMAAFMITPKALSVVGLLDEKYFMFFEDLDYCRRIKAKNLKVIYNPKVSAVHHHGASGKNVADEKNQWRRLIPGSIRYNGIVKHYILWFIIWTGQKWQKIH